MKLGVSMWSYFQSWKAGRMGIGGFIREAKAIGVDGVELLDFFYRDPSDPWNGNLDPARAEALRKEALGALKATGLPCPIFSVSQNFAKVDPGARAAELDKIRFGLQEAQTFGAGVVRVFAGDVAEGITFDQARQWIVEGLAEASNLAADAGLLLGLENHGQLAGRGDQIKGLIDDVRARCGNRVLGANPDTGNFLLVDEPSHQAVETVAPYATMVHFKDFKMTADEPGPGVFTSLQGNRFRGAVLGEGEVNLPLCIAALKNAGYDGWLSIEFEGDEAPETAVPRCVANARAML